MRLRVSMTPRNVTLAGSKYRIREKLGAGAFGEIFAGVNTLTGAEVAIKRERVKPNGRKPVLMLEAKVYRHMHGAPGFPLIRWCGKEAGEDGEEHCYLVMERLGESLEGIFARGGQRFGLKTVLLLAEQMLTRVQAMHERGFVHRDMKPDNFLMGRGANKDVVYLIDLGLAKSYRSALTGEHIPFKEGKAFTGTTRYASLNAHAGLEASRRDDLEALGYIWVYFLRGRLPWQGMFGDEPARAVTPSERQKRVAAAKLEVSVEDLCDTLPEEFCTYLLYCRSLRFDETPSYTYLRKLFRDLYTRMGYEEDATVHIFPRICVDER